MKKELKKFIIYVIFVFVTGFSAFFYYGYYQSSQFDGTIVPYIEEVLPKLSTWDPEIVKQFMAAEVLRTITDENLKNIMGALAQIGELQSIEEVKFKKKATGGAGDLVQQPVVTYTVKAKYSTGDATVIISLLDKGGSYDVFHFNFESEALFK
ncbi:MAG: hypothetical protein U9R69_02755 [Thermodesulfobacteriota bacterium]|nr:hypothetical protein [Thermodesulfobacteriota bacterium]